MSGRLKYVGVAAPYTTRYAVYFCDGDSEQHIGYAQRYRSIWRAVDVTGNPIGAMRPTRHQIGDWLLERAEKMNAMPKLDIAHREYYEDKNEMDEAAKAIKKLLDSRASKRISISSKLQLQSVVEDLEHQSAHIVAVWD